MVTGNSHITTRAEYIDGGLESTPASESLLSIFYSGDGLSFCLSHTPTKKILLLADYQLDTRPEAGLELLKQFNETFGEYILSWQVEHSTWVPKELLTQESIPTISKEVMGISKVQHTEIDELDATLLHEPIPPVLERIYESLSSAKLLPKPASEVIAFSRYWKSKPGDHFYLNVGENTIDIIAFSNGKLQLQNTYPTDSIEDQLYFVLYAYEQLKFNTEEVPLKITGSIEENSTLWNTYQKYIRNVDWLDHISGLNYSSAIPIASIRKYAPLVHLAACV